MSELDKDKLKYVAGGQSADGLPEKLKDAIKAYEDMLNSVPEAEKPTDRNDKDGWNSWWNWRKLRPFLAVTGHCARCGGYCGTNGSLCKECREWVNS